MREGRSESDDPPGCFGIHSIADARPADIALSGQTDLSTRLYRPTISSAASASTSTARFSSIPARRLTAGDNGISFNRAGSPPTYAR